jgi:hypothetical protein
MAELQREGAAGRRWFPGADAPQQEQPPSGPKRRRRRQAQAGSDRRAGYLAGELPRTGGERGPLRRPRPELPDLRRGGLRKFQRQRRRDQRHMICFTIRLSFIL